MTEMNLYCAGGCSMNIGSMFALYDTSKDKHFAALKTYFIDTSRSNLDKRIDDDQLYIIDELDGSGKKRDRNYGTMSEKANEILHKFRPAKINIVLHSTSGGTGSTMAPILVSELLKRDAMVIVLAIGSTGSRIETENTIKTLKSYESISKLRSKPINVHYLENSASSPRGTVDADMKSAIGLLAGVYSGNNRELDTADIEHFLDYTKVTSNPPRLSYMGFFEKEFPELKGQYIQSLLSLTTNDISADVDVPVPYQAVAYIPDTLKDLIKKNLPIHIASVSGFFNPIIERLSKKLEAYDDANRAHVSKPILDSSDDSSTEEGLLL